MSPINFTPFPHVTLLATFALLFSISTSSVLVLGLNITSLLSSFPDLSGFSNLLSNTSVAADLSHRSSITLLVVPNNFLFSNSDITNHRISPTSLADILRYHVILEFLSVSDIHQVPPNGKLVTTLFQTTGRASDNSGSVNITRDPLNGVVSIHSPVAHSPSNASVISAIKTLPYNISIFSVNSLLIPYGFDLMASETQPLLGLNITKALINGHNFNVAASMLSASGVAEEFEADEGGAGITLFIPTDSAFSDLPATVDLQSLPADKKAVVLKFHALHSYYPLGSLESIVNPVQPTLATEANGAGSFTLNISRVNGSVAISTGIVQASVTQTVFDENPVAIFGVSEVLLPREIFGINPNVTAGRGGSILSSAPTPEMFVSPGSKGPASHLSSPTGVGDKIPTGAAIYSSKSPALAMFCVGLYLLVLY